MKRHWFESPTVIRLRDEIRHLLGSAVIVFVTLKLTGLTDWSWWWVLAPMWAPLTLLATVPFYGLWLWMKK